MTATATRQTTMRTATVEDLPALAPLAREFTTVATKMQKDFDMERFCSLWKVLLGNGSGVIFVLEDDGVPIGALGGMVYPEPYNDSLLAQEFFMFIRSESRGGFGLLKMLRAFESWARTHGCAVMRIAHLEDSQPEKLGRLYQRIGFERVETCYGKYL